MTILMATTLMISLTVRLSGKIAMMMDSVIIGVMHLGMQPVHPHGQVSSLREQTPQIIVLKRMEIQQPTDITDVKMMTVMESQTCSNRK